MSESPPTAAERFAAILRYLGLAVAAMSGGDRLTYQFIGFVITRITTINLRVAALAASIRDGSYVPRRATPRRPPSKRQPPQPSKLPRKFGWLLPLVPDAVCFRSQLEYLLRDPEMAALLAAAPASLGRPLRSVCWMLRLDPPESIAPPPRPRPPRPPKPPRPKREKLPPPYPPTRPDAPAWMHGMPHPTNWSFGRRRGSPKTA